MISNNLINNLIKYSDNKYNSFICEHINGECVNSNCFGNCKECLNQIHFPNNYLSPIVKKDYNYQKIICYYICDYLVKYASEMYYLFESGNLISKMRYY